MSVTTVNEMYLERGGASDENGISVKRVFQVFTDSAEDDALLVMQNVLIPQYHDDHPTSVDLWVDKVTPTPGDVDGQTWKVNVDYTEKPPGAGGTQPGEIKPWDLNPVIGFGFVPVQRVLEKAYATFNGADAQPDWPALVRGVRSERVTNSCGQPFDPPAMMEEYWLLISISRNTQDDDFDTEVLKQFQNTINRDAVRVAGINFNRMELLCRDYKALQVWTEADELYWQETIEILVNEETWMTLVVDQGLFTADAAPPASNVPYTYTPILDDGDPPRQITEPVLLDGARQRLGSGQPPVYIYCHALWEEVWAGWLPTEKSQG